MPTELGKRKKERNGEKNTMRSNLKNYVKERDKMLKKCSVSEYRKFVHEHKQSFTKEFISAFDKAADEVLEISLHKMIVNAVKLPKNMRDRSAQWLVMRGFDLNIN